MGMKREAVQEERQRTKERDNSEVESTSNIHTDMTIERILEAEKKADAKNDQPVEFEVNIFIKFKITIGSNCICKVAGNRQNAIF